eukprot:TRINITY_DN4909_c0_g1_i3.p1 TRINITY_DN4909_c0_g1~~TRINITY_DN4909_c0_g1_i3.p1  ORF type:complete len:342 (-),score=71.36 TRINITY_DN4909_c0_g1_i3:882-1907(-)
MQAIKKVKSVSLKAADSIKSGTSSLKNKISEIGENDEKLIDEDVEEYDDLYADPESGNTPTKSKKQKIDVKAKLQKAKEFASEGLKTVGEATKEATKVAKEKTKAAGNTLKETGASIQEKVKKKKDKNKTKSENSDDDDEEGEEQAPSLPDYSFNEPVINPAVFGIPLESTLMSGNIPLLVRDTLQVLLDNSWYREEGIFRLSTSHQSLQAAKRSYDLREPINLLKHNDPHLPACLLKLFLREMTQSVFTDLYVPYFQQAIGFPGAVEQKINQVKNLLNNLPKIYYNLLNEIFSFFRLVISFESENKMNEQNLAVLFVPAMKVTSTELFLFMIKNAAYLFQ